ncbi:hypothetical protein G6F57_021353 [Rhizopus arrhizus]|nr:hypothetical protein G6F57_021353 [Rhizopus arrhizus]
MGQLADLAGGLGLRLRGGRSRDCGRPFAGDLARRFVRTQALEHGVADMPAARPVTERHFGNQFRLHPLHAPALASRHRLVAGFDAGKLLLKR